MADEQDPAQVEAAALRARLAALSKEELVELAAQLAQTYVVEGLGTLAAATAEAQPARAHDDVGDETFAGMLRRLKQARPGDETLQKFIVNGEHIQVRTPMGNVDVTEYRRPIAPVAAPPRPVGPGAAPQPPSVPTNRDSIYNRELYQPPAQPGAAPPARNPQQNQPVTPAPAAQQAAPARPAQPGPAPAQPAPAAQPAKPGQPSKEDEQKAGKRIRMIELD